MSAARQNKSVWFYLFGRWPGGSWRGWELFTKRFWRHREYIWHDSVGKYLWRPWCWLRGHGGVKNVADHPSHKPELHCFRCGRWV